MNILVAPPARTGAERLPDGRLLGWAEWGPPDGTPVLLSPGAATSRRLGFGAAAADELGVRLISLDRPGLGASTPAPGRTFADFAAGVRAFAAGLGRPAMVGNSQGAPFALACAAAGVVGALALVSAADEVADPRFADVLPGELRRLTELSEHDPEAAEKIFSGFTPQAMWDLVTGGSPACDLAVYERADFAAAYREALREAFAQGPAGYARDTVLAMGRWGIDLAAIRVPVDVWYGELDGSHSPDLGEGLTARIPGAVRHVVPGIGGALLWTEPHRILRALLDRLAASPQR
ncbi:alpha/beta hydrolase [Nonomuraea sp. WAC 01424]|uniref:alpha/beta fold hydrolase n=1 Tax=Nonomuraea sp. WAC 01424 TaxID=2203200 RepID=UPI000F7B31AB|nr:alpha/beta hydrolase [Nonomuraea sp. WAC 01424]RSN10345.1 alpha/beta hydrolase [Nonomuraea sp. WAC 01424]